MLIAVVLVLLVGGSLLFHFLSPWWFTPIASNWQMMDETVNITFWITGIVFVAVNLFMAYAIVRHRHRQGQRAKYEPENKKLEWWLTGITTVGVAAMLTPGLFVWAKFIDVPQDAIVVEALGQQWNWTFRFPGRDGALGTTGAKLVTADNPFGIDPQDLKGRDDILITRAELHLPVGKPVKLLLRSNDVLHDFTVPQFRVKMDLVPGTVTHLWFTPTRTGAFDVLCEELCGVAHFAMRGRVVVDEAPAFESWLAGQPTYSQSLAQAAGDAAAGKASYVICSACHGANGEGNQSLNAPKLAGQSPWYLERQLTNFKQGLRGTRDEDVYGKQMAALAAALEGPSIKNVMAYLATLPDGRAPSTLTGDAARGKALYTTCAECHGAAGEGIWSTHAPRLAQMNDWYLARQLRNFKQGIRGGHPQDFPGAQMGFMARALARDEDISDLVAYIGTLR
ncbi:MAG: c-type cytochrome [Betaproteobacteria bacterium]|nr:c-type cytochrome [Betaproteobacteria bacterium]